MMFARLISAFALCLLAPAYSHAAEVEYVDEDGDGEGYIMLQGEIVVGDADKFRTIAASKKAQNVFLSSTGGSLPEAMEIGRIISVSAYRTVVTDGQVCASSCALIWLAGNPRFAQKNALIGFHAGYVVEDDKPIASGVANAMVGRYLTQLGQPASVVMFATAADPDEMLWLDTSDPKGEGISYEILPSTDEELAEEEKTPMPTMLEKSPQEMAAVNDKMFGKWMIVSEEGVVGVLSESTNHEARLGFFCTPGKPCRFALKMSLACDAGDDYSVKYRVEGYESKNLNMTCSMDEKTLFITDTQIFGKDIANQVSVTIFAENEKDQMNSFKFSLIGYTEAMKTLIQGDYIGLR